MKQIALLFTILLFLLSVEGLSAERFPKSHPEQDFSMMKIYGQNGSPLRVPREDWAGARETIESSAEWKYWLNAERASLDAWMAEPRDRVEYVAGWWHDFVSPVDGAFLEWMPAPPKDAPPKVFGGWVFGLRSRNGAFMIDAARMWRLTGEQKYFDWAAEQLDFYADNLERWPIQTGFSKSRLMCQSLDDANMLVRFVQAARILDGAVPEQRKAAWLERKQKWIDQLFRPMTLLLDETFQRVHNIACWQRSAMAMAAIYTNDAELWSRSIDGEFGIRRQVRDGITSDYFWLEQSLGYNSYVVSAFLPLLEMAGFEGRLKELEAEAAAVENLMLAPVAIRFPDGKLPTPADTTGAFRKAPDGSLLASARRIFPTPIGVAHAAGAKNWANLLDPPMNSAPELVSPAVPNVESRSFESSRFALLKKDGWQIFFHYGQLDRSHSQAEALSYEAYFGNTDVTHDAGTVGYGSPLHRGYYTTAAAHNVPVIDGKGQVGWNEGELLGFDAAAAHVGARQHMYQPGVSATRWLSIEDGALVESTTIETTDGAAHRLGIAIHVQGKVALPASAAVTLNSPFPHWTEAREWQGSARTGLNTSIGSTAFTLRVEGPSAMRIVHATVPDAPPQKREALYFEVEGPRATFRTIWKPEGVLDKNP